MLTVNWDQVERQRTNLQRRKISAAIKVPINWFLSFRNVSANQRASIGTVDGNGFRFLCMIVGQRARKCFIWSVNVANKSRLTRNIRLRPTLFVILLLIRRHESSLKVAVNVGQFVKRGQSRNFGVALFPQLERLNNSHGPEGCKQEVIQQLEEELQTSAKELKALELGLETRRRREIETLKRFGNPVSCCYLLTIALIDRPHRCGRFVHQLQRSRYSHSTGFVGSVHSEQCRHSQ